ncbi:MAG: membrane bound O-acyl transferase family-domain-containing protein [Gemmataceae bacterium]|nr:membrane bound O-acyl transferase family-domain-containing protein [Gemmataceae bacterium]
MSAYWPDNVELLWLVAAMIAGTLAAGLGISRLHSVTLGRLLAWALAIGATLGVERLSADAPAGFRMLAICGTLLFAMKAVVTVEAQASGQPRLTPSRWLEFAALWFGMWPQLFARERTALQGSSELIGNGLRRLALGLALIALARFIWTETPALLGPYGARLAATVVLLPGLSLVLHFGIFNIVAGAWRHVGVDCRPLFRAPLRARTLGDFWSRRWNLAFTEMAALGVYRPMAGWLGRSSGTVAAFLFSGLVHELAISVPVGAGYGLPTLYFVLHGSLVLGERRWGRIERWGAMAHVWTLGWLALPLPLLFHPWFLEGVVWPLIGMESHGA